MIVVDASAAVLALLNDGDARRMLAAEPVVVPHLIDAEVTHALRGHLRGQRLTGVQGRAAIARWMRLGLRRFAVAGLLPRIWDLRDSLGAYDATYVALAEALGCALVTADARLSRAPGPTCAVTVVRR